MSEENIKKTIGLDDKENVNWLEPYWTMIFMLLFLWPTSNSNKETMKMPDYTQSYISYLNGKIDAYEKMFTEK